LRATGDFGDILPADRKDIAHGLGQDAEDVGDATLDRLGGQGPQLLRLP